MNRLFSYTEYLDDLVPMLRSLLKSLILNYIIATPYNIKI